MAQHHHTAPPLAAAEEVVIVLLCLVDGSWPIPTRTMLRVVEEALRLKGYRPCLLPAFAGRGERALLPARRRSLLRSPLSRGSVSLAPSSLHRRIRNLRRFVEP